MVGSAIVGTGAATTQQAAVVSAIAMLAGGVIAGAVGENSTAAAITAQNEAQNNCTVHECWNQVTSAFQGALSSIQTGGSQVWNSIVNSTNVSTYDDGASYASNLAGVESQANTDVDKALLNVVLNLPSVSLPGQAGYVQYFQYNSQTVGTIGEQMALTGLFGLASGLNASGTTAETSVAAGETGSTTPANIATGSSAAQAAGSAGATAATNTSASGASVWSQAPTARGVTIESQLAQTEYSAANGWYQVGAENNGYFPLVDFQNGNTLVSLKTVDTTGMVRPEFHRHSRAV